MFADRVHRLSAIRAGTESLHWLLGLRNHRGDYHTFVFGADARGPESARRHKEFNAALTPA